MSDYRLYCLDGSGRFNKSHEIRAANDGEALAIARKMKLPVKCELWDKARMVAELPPGASLQFSLTQIALVGFERSRMP